MTRLQRLRGLSVKLIEQVWDGHFAEPRGNYYGSQVRPRKRRESQTGDARDEARQAPQRALRQEGQEPQTGDRDWFVGGTSHRRKGATQEKPLRLPEAQTC